MLEMLCVARALGYREAELPAETVDGIISLVIQNSQSKGNVSRVPSALKASPETRAIDRRINPDVPPEDRHADGTKVKSIGVDGPMGQPSFKPSMLIDMERNRPIELEPIIGAVLERAKSKAIETPRLDL
jgi:2-dehydropantoate 2-reductase